MSKPTKKPVKKTSTDLPTPHRGQVGHVWIQQRCECGAHMGPEGTAA